MSWHIKSAAHATRRSENTQIINELKNPLQNYVNRSQMPEELPGH